MRPYETKMGYEEIPRSVVGRAVGDNKRGFGLAAEYMEGEELYGHPRGRIAILAGTRELD